jgi:GNAT superfamily N-acetyltransferase/acyl carrier protein
LATEDLSNDLRAFLESCEVPGAAGFGDDTSLLASGAIDSVALFNLVGWIEARIGRVVDPTSVELPGDWDSIAKIVRYVECSISATLLPSAQLASNPLVHDPGAIGIVRYSAENAEQVARLQTRLWSPDPALNLQYLRWKYTENPCGDGSDIYLAFDQRELIGMRGFYPSWWECHRERKRFDILVADDLVLRDDYRNQGLVSQMMQVAIEDLQTRGREYVFNLSGGVLTVLGSLAMGWRSAGQFEPTRRLSWQVSLRTALGNQVSRLPYFWRLADSLKALPGAERAPFAELDRAAGSNVVEHGRKLRISRKPKPAEMAALISGLPYDGRIRHVRDESYLAWRFRNPLREYRFLFAGESQLDGYLVLHHSIAQTTNRRVSIVDLEANDARTRHALLDAAIRLGRFSELAAWLATLDPGTARDLQKRGFRPADAHLTAHGCPCVLVRCTDDARPPETWSMHGVDLLEFGNWDLRQIYTMAG